MPHSGRPLLRMGSDGEASREKDIPIVQVAFCGEHFLELERAERSHCVQGRAVLATSSSPSPEKECVGLKAVGLNKAIECQGISLFSPQEWCPKLEASFQLQILQLCPRMAFPLADGDGHLSWECGIVPQIHSLDAKGCRNEEVTKKLNLRTNS